MGFFSIGGQQLSRAKGGGMLGGGSRGRETLALPSPLLGYSCAVLLAALAQICRIPLHPQTVIPHITYVPFMLFAGWYCGFGPGLLTAVLCTLECLYFTIEPLNSFAVAAGQDWVGLAILLLTGVVSTLLFEVLRKARRSDAMAQSRADIANRHLAAIVDSSEDAIIGKDLNGVITSWNRSAERIFGYSAQDAIGQPITFFMDPRVANEELVIQSRIWNGESVDHYETRRRRKDGTEVFVSVSISPILDASGRIVGASKITRDITERKKQEEIRERQAKELAIQSTLLRSIVENSPAAIAVLGGPAFAFELVNPAYQAFQPGVAMKGKTVQELWADAAPIVLPLLRGVRETQTPYHASAMPIPRRLGPDAPVEERFFTFSYVPLPELSARSESRILVVALDVTDMKRAELNLRENEERFRTLANAIPNLCWMANGDGWIFWYNQRWYEYTGTTQQQMEGWGWKSVHDPQTLPAVVERWKGSIATGEPFEMVFPLRGADGVFRPFLTRVIPIKNTEGRVVRWFGTNTDITELRDAQEALRRAAEFDEAALKSLGEGLITIDTGGLVTSMNPAAEKLFGWTFAELRGKKLHEMIHHHRPDGRPFPSSECAGFQALKHGQSLKNYEDAFVRKDGTFFDATFSSAPLRDAAGQINGLVYVFNDITERKRAEDARRETLDRLERVMEIETVGIMFWDLNTGCMTGANDTFLKLMGYSQHDIEARELTWQKLTPPEYVDVSRAEVEKFLATGRVGPYEKEYFHKDGTRQWLLFAGSSLGNNQCVEFCVDISDRKKAEAALRESEEQLQQLNSDLERRVQARTAELTSANKELESFTHSVSHDLRAPLRGIDGWSLALLEDYGDKLDEQAREYLDRVRTETQRMGRLIDDLLRLSRVTRAEMIPMPVDLSSLVNLITSRVRNAHPEWKTEFSIQPGLTAEGDPRLLEVALTNLLDNAAKFSSKRADAKVEFGAVGGRDSDCRKPHFFVHDNGAGFDMSHANLLFGAFQRLHSASEFPGTGIGLATVQRVISRHGGRIWAESKPDEGATFYFTIGGAN